MAPSDQLSRPAVWAKQAEDSFAAARTQARDRLGQDVRKAREDTEAAAEKLRTESAQRPTGRTPG